MKFVFCWCAALVLLTGAWFVPGCTNSKDPRVEVLIYHELKPDGSQEWPIIDPDLFYEQINTLLQDGWQPLTLEKFYAWQQEEYEIETNSFLLTFDDGGESIYHYAYPYLLEKKIPAVIFLIAKYHDPAYIIQEKIWVPKLTEEQIVEMAESGIIDFQSHSYDLHREVEGVPAVLALSHEEVLEDFIKSIEVISDLTGGDVYSIAYPSGEVNDEVIVLAREAGFHLGFAGNILGEANRDEPMTIKRFPLDNISMSAFKRYYKYLW